MGIYLNKDSAEFESYLNDDIFIDKSLLLNATNNNINKKSSKYMCVTRPRRFGKSLALSMLNAYYSKGSKAKELFDKLKISSDKSYLDHLNKHNVIWIDMSRIYLKYKNEVIQNLNKVIVDDIKTTWPNILKESDNSIDDAIIRIYEERNERFIFLIDEWDIIFREEEQNAKLCNEYIEFLRLLFKSSDVSSCIDLVYMTGILPIRRYSTQSTLNMFTEYNMIDSDILAPFIGFTEEEVKGLCVKYNRDYNEIKTWYDGYRLNGVKLYNPKSVVTAVLRNKCQDYWVQTSAREAVTDYMNYDKGELKGLITKMIVGDEVDVNVSKFDNDLTKVNSKDAALTVLIHLGYLAYDEFSKKCYIPNHEIKEEFINAIDCLNWTETYDPISISMKLYEETLKGNTDFVNETLDNNHASLASMYNKNKEDVLSVIVTISYYRCNEFYFIRKEDTSAFGRADITFTPCDNNHIPVIIELKADDTALNAINQIKNKNYTDVFKGYKGKVLLLGIAYDSKTLKHESKIEFVEI